MKPLLLLALVVVQVACARCPVAPVSGAGVPETIAPAETGPAIKEIQDTGECTLVLEKLGKCQRRYVM